LKAKKRWDLLTALDDRDMSLYQWAKLADVDVKTILKRRDELLQEGTVERYVKQEDGITYYHLKDRAALVRVSVSSPDEPEYVVRQAVAPEAREISFKGKIPQDGSTVRKDEMVRSSIVVGRPYWKAHGEEELAQFRRENGWPTLTQQEKDEWLEKIAQDAEFTVGPPPDGAIPGPGLKRGTSSPRPTT